MKKETFDFSEALRRMKEGKKVRRLKWYDDSYITINSYNEIISYHAGNYLHMTYSEDIFSLDDILATDWEEVKG